MKTLWAICPMVTCTTTPFKPEQRRQDRNEDVRENRVKNHLKDRVKSYQTSGILIISSGQLTPHNDHGNAAGQTYHDKPHHVVGITPQKDDSQNEHQDRTDNPVLY